MEGSEIEDSIKQAISEMMEKESRKFLEYMLLCTGRELIKSGAATAQVGADVTLQDGKRYRVNIDYNITDVQTQVGTQE